MYSWCACKCRVLGDLSRKGTASANHPLSYSVTVLQHSRYYKNSTDQSINFTTYKCYTLPFPSNKINKKFLMFFFKS